MSEPRACPRCLRRARLLALLGPSLERALSGECGAVPGPVTSPTSAGANELLAAGACVIRGGEDVLAAISASGGRPGAGVLARPEGEA